MADPKTELFEHLVQRLNATTGDTQAQAAVAAEFLIMARPEPEREALRSALDAAAGCPPNRKNIPTIQILSEIWR
jgi:hypothetical protein